MTGEPKHQKTELFRIGSSSLRKTLFPREKTDGWHVAQGEKKALALFHEAARRVPAYADFLKKLNIDSSRIESIEDFKTIPETDKKNYIAKYSLAERSWDGKVEEAALIAASSGTTGTPTLWPRGREQELEATLLHEALFKDLYQIHKRKTLAIIGFPMGVYVSGVATTLPLFLTASRVPTFSIATPGNNKESVLRLIPEVRDLYEQVILIGHPFFVKDIIETAEAENISWGNTQIRMFFCSEGFSEEWRGYVARHVPNADPKRDLFNSYGSSELLLMAYENPETVSLKEFFENHESESKKVFGRAQAPSLFQYNPLLRHIETNTEGELLFTASAGIPLLRFNLHDAGKVLLRTELEANLGSEKETLKQALEMLPWKPWKLPFVALHGRSDHTLVFYAANIYPENIHRALNHADFLDKITGKFQLEKQMQDNMDQKLIVHVELQKATQSDAALATRIQDALVQTLEQVNMEYLFLRKNLQKDVVPQIMLHPYQDPVYFKPGLKPKYIA